MSLLSNLLAFSSLNQFGQRQQRSASANNKFLFQADDNDKATELKQRVVSKSLSKMGLLSNSSQSKVDPKYRCLHRIVHNLSMKVRKHYYGFFVTLQTIKKNKQNQTKKPKASLEKLQSATAKINQMFSIRYQKQYQNSYKEQMFKKLKLHAQKSVLSKTADKIYINNQYKFSCIKLFKFFHAQDKIKIKLDLMESAMQPIIKKYGQIQIQNCFAALKVAERQIVCKNQAKQVEKQEVKQTASIEKQRRSVSIFEIFDKIQRKASQSSENMSQVNDFQFNRKGKTNDINNVIKMSEAGQNFPTNMQIKSKQIKADKGTLKNQDLHSANNQRISFNVQLNNRQDLNEVTQKNKYHSLQASPIKNCQQKTKTPYATSKKILNLRQSVAKDCFEVKTYQKVYKCYQVSLDYEQKPFQFEPHYESVPKMVHKMTPQDFAFPEVQDLADKSNIFRDFQNSKAISYIDSLEISSVVGEPFMRAQTLISDIQRNRQRFEASSMSQISYVPYLPHEASVASINQKQQSNFGCDAVNFKNSLVMERESMKKTQRQKVDMFIKKKTLINTTQLVDHQSQQLKNLRNRRKNKELPEKNVGQPISTNYESNYEFQTEYLIKRDTSSYETTRGSINIMNNYNTISNWENKRPHHEYNSQGKMKSLSFNSNTSDLVPRRLRYDGGDFEKKSSDDTFIPNFYSVNNSYRDYSWKGDVIENRLEMPVRDVGMDPFSKMKMKNGIGQSQTQINKDYSSSNSKKFINISKR